MFENNSREWQSEEQDVSLEVKMKSARLATRDYQCFDKQFEGADRPTEHL